MTTINSNSKKQKLGLFTLTSLVAGNMIGSGVFILPSDLARVGSISLFSWGFTALGAFLLALVFSKMSSINPKTGGPYAYASSCFGEFMGFQTAYTYWIAVWVGNTAVAIALMGYLRVFFPGLANPSLETAVVIGFVWILTLINITGVRTAGAVQLVTTILKFVPLVVVAILGIFYFHPEYLTHSFNVSGKSNFSAFSYATTLTLWAFIGVESATVPAASVDKPERNIPLATLLGTLIAAALYVMSSTAIMAMVPISELANSASPFAAAAQAILGKWGALFIAAGATISCFGGLNGWILIQGQVAMAAADDGLFPRLFSVRNRANAPVWSLIITSALMSVLLLMTSDPNLVNQFQLLILVAATGSLIAYFYTAIAAMVWSVNHGRGKIKKASLAVAILAGVYAFWALFGSGQNIVFYAMMLLFSSLPFYVLMVWGKRRREEVLG